MNIWRILLVLLLLYVHSDIFSQDKIFRLNLEGKSYERLVLGSPEMYLEGESENGYNWIFRIPQDIYEASSHFTVDFKKYDREQRAEFNLLFLCIEGNDTLGTYYNTLDLSDTVLNVSYIDSVKNIAAFANPVTIFADRFKVNYSNNINLELIFKYPRFSYFSEITGEEDKEYEEYIQEYVKICQSYPHARHLLVRMFKYINKYRAKTDVQKLYDCFTEELKNSYYGKKIQKYLTGYDFENIELLCADNETSNYIIENPDKYTLINFTASWCRPCHLLIPTLKQLYADLGEHMDIMYISRDELQTVPQWQSFMEKENIPWRSFLSYNNKAFCDRYDVRAIPYSLLVTPEGKAEVINLRNDEERNNLYKLFNVDGYSTYPVED